MSRTLSAARVLGLGVGLLGIVTGAAAQEGSEPGLREEVKVSRHLLEVVALDPDGRPLEGLRAENFDVRVDGERRPVTSVDAPQTARPAPSGQPATDPAAPQTPGPAQAAAEAPAEPGRWVTIVFHSDGISLQQRKHAVASAVKLKESLGPNDRLAVAVLKQGSIAFIQPFAPAPQVSADAFPILEGFGGQVDPVAIRLRSLVEDLRTCRQNNARRDGSSPQAGNCYMRVSGEFLEYSRLETRDVLNALRGLVAAVAPLPGRKAVVLFTDGFVMQPGQIVIDSFERYDPTLGAYFSRLQDPPNWDFQDLISEAARRRVSFFAYRTGAGMDMAGRDASQSNPKEVEFQYQVGNAFRTFEQTSGGALRTLAQATGGRALLSPTARDLKPGFFDQLSGVYTLGIPAFDGDSIRSKVKVRLKGVKGDVTFAENLLRPTPRVGVVAGRLEVGKPEDGGVPVRLALRLNTLGVEKAVDEGAADTSRVALYWAAIDRTGNVVRDDYVMQALPRRTGEPDHFVYRFNLVLPRGTYTLKTSAADLVGHGDVTFTESVTFP